MGVEHKVLDLGATRRVVVDQTLGRDVDVLRCIEHEFDGMANVYRWLVFEFVVSRLFVEIE